VVGNAIRAGSPSPPEADIIADVAEFCAFGFARDDIAQWLDMPLEDLRRLIDTHRELFRSHRPYERARERFDHFNDESARLERELEAADTPWKIVRAADRLWRFSYQFIREEILCRRRLLRRHNKRREEARRARRERDGLGSWRSTRLRPKEPARIDPINRGDWEE
jgi:hypothetical protein